MQKRQVEMQFSDKALHLEVTFFDIQKADKYCFGATFSLRSVQNCCFGGFWIRNLVIN